MFDEKIRGCTESIEDAIENAKFRVSKLMPNSFNGVPKNVHLIRSLKLDLKKGPGKYRFNNSAPRQPMKEVKLTGDLSATAVVIFDVQFLHSQGLRSEMVDLSARVFDSTRSFQAKCATGDELHLQAEDKSCFRPIKEALLDFLTWLEEVQGDAKAKLVLASYQCFPRKWPGLVNHFSFYQLLNRFSALVLGVSDLKKSCDPLEKVAKNKLNMDVEMYRSDEVIEATHAILHKLLTANSDSFTKILAPVVELEWALNDAKRKLDASIGEDITRGIDFEEKEYANHRIKRQELLTCVM